LLVDYSERIVALSEHNVRLLLQIGARLDKIAIIPNGVCEEEYVHLRKSKEILDEVESNGPILLYVGRIDWNKQVDKVIEAMPLILKSFPSAKFVIIGPDYANYSGELSRLASRTGVKQAVVMAGRVTAERLREFYSAADIFLLPSSYEGFGLSMIEAMISKIPVIASSAGGPGDILDHGVHAWLMEAVTPEKIAESVRILLTDQQLRENLVKNAFELVKEKYTWERVVDKLEVVYDQVANK
jgi:glycosyltransferase involved in cell wall biosynthesis